MTTSTTAGRSATPSAARPAEPPQRWTVPCRDTTGGRVRTVSVLVEGNATIVACPTPGAASLAPGEARRLAGVLAVVELQRPGGAR